LRVAWQALGWSEGLAGWTSVAWCGHIATVAALVVLSVVPSPPHHGHHAGAEGGGKGKGKKAE
jgi:membrane associated rhomboid family serine protease